VLTGYRHVIGKREGLDYFYDGRRE